jgi:hypothetical protein
MPLGPLPQYPLDAVEPVGQRRGARLKDQGPLIS